LERVVLNASGTSRDASAFGIGSTWSDYSLDSRGFVPNALTRKRFIPWAALAPWFDQAPYRFDMQSRICGGASQRRCVRCFDLSAIRRFLDKAMPLRCPEGIGWGSADEVAVRITSSALVGYPLEVVQTACQLNQRLNKVFGGHFSHTAIRTKIRARQRTSRTENAGLRQSHL